MKEYVDTRNAIDVDAVGARRRNWQDTALALLLCSLILAPMIAYPMTADQGVFAYLGAQILKGRLPYMHTWESDFPGLMFLQAAEIFVFGKSIFMFRLFDCLV